MEVLLRVGRMDTFVRLLRNHCECPGTHLLLSAANWLHK